MGEPFASQIALCLGRKRQDNHRACLRRQFRFSSGAKRREQEREDAPGQAYLLVCKTGVLRVSLDEPELDGLVGDCASKSCHNNKCSIALNTARQMR